MRTLPYLIWFLASSALVSAYGDELPMALQALLNKSESIYITHDVVNKQGRKERRSVRVMKGPGHPGHIAIPLPIDAPIGHKLLVFKRLGKAFGKFTFANGGAYTIENGSFVFHGTAVSLDAVEKFLQDESKGQSVASDQTHAESVSRQATPTGYGQASNGPIASSQSNGEKSANSKTSLSGNK